MSHPSASTTWLWASVSTPSATTEKPSVRAMSQTARIDRGQPGGWRQGSADEATVELGASSGRSRRQARGLADAKVVQRDAHSGPRQRVERRVGDLGIVHDGGLGDLDHQLPRRDPARTNTSKISSARPRRLSCTPRDVDRHLHGAHRQPGVAPAAQLVDGLVQDPAAQRLDQAVLLGQRNEAVGRDLLALRVGPARERLEGMRAPRRSAPSAERRAAGRRPRSRAAGRESARRARRSRRACGRRRSRSARGLWPARGTSATPPSRTRSSRRWPCWGRSARCRCSRSDAAALAISIGWATTASSRSASRRFGHLVEALARIANSSAPSRASVSLGQQHLVEAQRERRRNSSPAACPAVVDALEVVDVEVEHRDPVALAATAGECVGRGPAAARGWAAGSAGRAGPDGASRARRHRRSSAALSGRPPRATCRSRAPMCGRHPPVKVIGAFSSPA